jgi:predicted ArsR family transcriptional regulator
MEIINLQTKAQLDIYMNPQRQSLLRILEKSKMPRTPKDLSLELGVSASSIQYHLKKLESLGLVYMDHTANIRGITAKYYAPTRVTVRIGGDKEDTLINERVALSRNLVADVLDNTISTIFRPNQEKCCGDVKTGVAHLTSNQAEELQTIIHDYLEKVNTPSKDTEPWEFALMYYRIKEKQ